MRCIFKLSAAVFLIFTSLTFNVLAAQNEMGTGKPVFGIYGQAVGAEIRIFSLNDATVAFPSGCTFLTLTPATLGGKLTEPRCRF
jgi:hypothetical protein